MQKLKLPKEHLSWSQASLWNGSSTKREYIRRYFFNEKTRFTNKYLDFGGYISRIIEDKTIDQEPQDVQDVLAKIPTLDIAEMPANLDFGAFKVIGFIDNASLDASDLLEYKTGVMWSQAKVDKHWQLDTYAAAVYQKYQIIPRVRLTSMETKEGANGEIKFTGKVKTFERKIVKKDIENVMDYYRRTAQEISDHYKMFLETLKY
jgi:hypothetical protein